MKTQIKIRFADDYYPFLVNWELPFFPSVGDILELEDILSEEQLEKAKKEKFQGRGKYEGLMTSLYEVIVGNLDCKIVEISWMKDVVDLYVENETFAQNPERWKYVRSQ